MAMPRTGSLTEKANTASIATSMQNLIAQLRSEIERVQDPRVQALYETSAEALQGLLKAVKDYDSGVETAFHR